MKRFELFEQWEDNDMTYSIEELTDILEPYAPSATLPDILNAAQGLTQIPGTAFYVLPVEEQPAPLRDGLLRALINLQDGLLTPDESVTDAQLLLAVTLAFGELQELRAVVENVRKQAEDNSRLAFYREKVKRIVTGKEGTPCDN